MRVLVTGITGFVGSHFADYALARGAVVVGSVRRCSTLDNVAHVRDRIELVEADLEDLEATRRLVEAARPDWIVHLAAQSSVRESWRAPAETFMTNTVSQINVLEAVRATTLHARCLVVGSSEEYGFVDASELPITETAPLRPLSPYAVSKVAQDLTGYQYFKSYGLHVVRSRAFNHEGPRRGDVFVTSKVARQIAEIEQKSSEPVITVEDLSPCRDFTDVRDIVRGYWRLLEAGQAGEVYNLCSGRTWTIRGIVEFLRAEAHVPDITVRESQDQDKKRPADVPVLRGDATKARTALGWSPEIPFEQTLRDLLDYWRGRL